MAVGSAELGLYAAGANSQIVHLNTFFLRGSYFGGFLTTVMSAVVKKRLCWRKDLVEFRGLSEQERTGFLLVLEWFEN